MITHRGIWAIAHTSSRSVSKHSCIPGAYHRKHLLIPCPTNTIVGQILSIVSNKHAPHLPWLRRELVWSASDKRAPCERSEQNIQSNKSTTRCKICTIFHRYACKICTIFEQLTAFFFPTPDCDTSCQSLTHAYRKLIKVGHSSRCVLTRSRSSKPPSQIKKTLARFMTYEQLFICCLSNLPPPIVSIVLRKLAIVNTASHKQEWTFVHSIVLRLIYQKFN